MAIADSDGAHSERAGCCFFMAHTVSDQAAASLWLSISSVLRVTEWNFLFLSGMIKSPQKGMQREKDQFAGQERCFYVVKRLQSGVRPDPRDPWRSQAQLHESVFLELWKQNQEVLWGLMGSLVLFNQGTSGSVRDPI